MIQVVGRSLINKNGSEFDDPLNSSAEMRREVWDDENIALDEFRRLRSTAIPLEILGKG